jgi:hypothetical protein
MNGVRAGGCLAPRSRDVAPGRGVPLSARTEHLAGVEDSAASEAWCLLAADVPANATCADVALLESGVVAGVESYKLLRLGKLMTSVATRSEIFAMPVEFAVGDAVVHPHHGAGVVISRGPRRLLGATRDYLEIELAHHSLKIMVPCDARAASGCER